MTAADIRTGLRSGLLLGVIIIFLLLVGAIFTLADILSGGGRGSSQPSLLLLLVLIALWIGTQVTRPAVGQDALPWGSSLLRAAVAGAVGGLMIGVVTLVITAIASRGANLRTYLFQLSPQNLDLWAMGFTPQIAALFHFGLATVSSLLGGVLARLLRGWHLRDRLSRRTQSVGTTRDRLLAKAKGKPWVRIVSYAAIAALLYFIPAILNNYWNFTLGTVGIYVLMGLGLNIVVGLAGLLDLGYVVFFAVGSYAMGLLTAPTPHNLRWDFWVVIPIGIVLAAVIGVLLGVPVLRLRGDYLAIVTLGFGEIIRVLLKAESLASFSNGPRGIPAIGQPKILGFPFDSGRDYMYMIILAILLAILLTNRLQNSRVGRAWIAIREDETVARAMGINTLSAKLLAFGVGAAFAGLGGALFAARNQFTGPDDFNLMVSINVLAVVIVGGMGSVPGVIAGAFVLKGLPEVLRELEAYRILSFGALLVVMMIVRPEGLIPSRRRRLEMHEAEAPPVAAETQMPPAASSGGT